MTLEYKLKMCFIGFMRNQDKIGEFRRRIYDGEKPLTYQEANEKLKILKDHINHGTRFEDCEAQIERTVEEINGFVNHKKLNEKIKKAKITAAKWSELVNFEPEKYKSSTSQLSGLLEG